MTTRTFIDKNGNSWSWEETAETQKAVQELTKFSGNYSGPLYALHPDLNQNETTTNTKSADVG